MKKRIMLEGGGTVEINEDARLEDIRRHVPNFFAKPFGRRERYIMHRGCLIVRYSITYSDEVPRRETVAYLFTMNLGGCPDTFCVSAGSDIRSIQAARKLLDMIIDGGSYHYGIKALRPVARSYRKIRDMESPYYKFLKITALDQCTT